MAFTEWAFFLGPPTKRNFISFCPQWKVIYTEFLLWRVQNSFRVDFILDLMWTPSKLYTKFLIQQTLKIVIFCYPRGTNIIWIFPGCLSRKEWWTIWIGILRPKLHVFFRPESTAKRTTWKWTLTIFKYKNQCRKQTELKK